MKKVMRIPVIIIFVGLIFTAGGVLTAADLPDEINIENQGYKSKKAGPVTFPHLEHAEDFGLDCNGCHHVYKDGENTWKDDDPVQRCTECHSPLKMEGKMMRLPNAYHAKCKGCHKKTREQKDKCSDCHK